VGFLTSPVFLDAHAVQAGVVAARVVDEADRVDEGFDDVDLEPAASGSESERLAQPVKQRKPIVNVLRAVLHSAHG
jgi:hypothetical protein